MIRYLIEGGIFMWVILLTSICGVAIILEKMWMLATKEKDFKKNIKGVFDIIEYGEVEKNE